MKKILWLPILGVLSLTSCGVNTSQNTLENSSLSDSSSLSNTLHVVYAQCGIDPDAPEKFVAPTQQSFECLRGITWAELAKQIPNPAPVKGYDFSAWYLGDPEDGGFALKNSVEPVDLTESIDLYARFTPKKYDISWSYSEATFNAPKHRRAYGESVSLTGSSYSPTKAGYDFAGWKDKEGTVVSSIERFHASDIALNATWSSALSYPINYSTIGVSAEYSGEILDSTNNPNPFEYTIEDNIELKSPSIDGYRFLRFEKDGAITSSIRKGTTGSLDLYAVFNPISYSVTFGNCKSGSVQTMHYTRADNDFTLPSAPETVGWSFLGWKDQNDNMVTSIPHGSTGDFSLTAQWAKEVGSISYSFPDIEKSLWAKVGNDNPSTYDVEDKLEFKSASYQGYDFDGWFVERDGSLEKIDSLTPGSFEKNLCLIGRFSPHNYTISYGEVAGSINENVREYTVLDGEILLKPAKKSGYEFLGWLDENGVVINSIDPSDGRDRSLTASWRLVEYKINYQAKGVANDFLGEVEFPSQNSFTVVSSAEDLELEDASCEGYTFRGWYEDEELTSPISRIDPSVLADVTVYAKFTPIQYHISYVGVEGAGLNNNPVSYTVEDPDIVISDISKTGYQFQGWKEGTLIRHGSTGDRSFEAMWGLKEYSISYRCSDDVSHELGFDKAFDDGNAVYSYTIEDETYTLQNASCPGYVFDGWYDDETNNRVTEIRSGSFGDRSLSARFKKETYTVTYSSTKTYSPIGNPTSFNVETQTLSLNHPSCPGYEFLGWTDTSGNLVQEIPQGTTGNVELQANWSDAIVYSITYQAEGVPEKKKNDIKWNVVATQYTVEKYISLTNSKMLKPYLSGYLFKGWSMDEIQRGSTGDLTIIGRFEPITYTVSYTNLKNQKTNNITTYTVEDDAIELDVISHDQYQFAGWVNDSTGESISKIGGGQVGKLTIRAVWTLKGEGTKSDPKLIYAEDQLREIETSPNACFSLRNDIEISGEWDPIGSVSSPFSGTLFGNGKSINFVNASPASDKRMALIDTLCGSVSNLSIKGNVGQENSRIDCDSYGALCIDFNGSDNAVTNVTSSVTAYLTSSSTSLIAGGISAKITSGYMRECVNNARINCSVPNGNGCNVGGIVGDGVDGTMSKCRNTANGTLLGTAETARVGGLIGLRKVPAGTSVYVETASEAENENLALCYVNGATDTKYNIIGHDSVTDLHYNDVSVKAPKVDPIYSGDGYFYMVWHKKQGYLLFCNHYWAYAWIPYKDGTGSDDENTFKMVEIIRQVDQIWFS